VLIKLRGDKTAVLKEIEEYRHMNSTFLATNIRDAILQPAVLYKLAIVCIAFFIQVFSGKLIYLVMKI